VVLDTGETLATRAIVIATGAQYNKPPLANRERFEGGGIYYGATHIESQWCEGEQVAVVGGANSAGQAAVFLAQSAHHVHMLVRGGELSGTMSRYLIQRLTENPNIELHFNTEIVALEGESCLQRDDGGLAANRVAAGMRGAGRQGLHSNRTGSGLSRAGEWPQVDAPAPSPNAGDQPARGVRGRGRARRQCEAGSVGRRRGRNQRPYGSPNPGGVVAAAVSISLVARVVGNNCQP
jgi:hypothetical protein